MDLLPLPVLPRQPGQWLKAPPGSALLLLLIGAFVSSLMGWHDKPAKESFIPGRNAMALPAPALTSWKPIQSLFRLEGGESTAERG